MRTRYEIALWLAARDALRARRLYRAGSHRYGDPAAWMMPPQQWAAERVELAAVFDRPLDAQARLAQLQGDQERLVRALQHGHETGVDVLYDGEKIVGRRPGAQPVPASARELVASTHAMLPMTGLITGQPIARSALPEFVQEKVQERVEFRDGAGAIEALVQRAEARGEAVKISLPMGGEIAQLMSAQRSRVKRSCPSIGRWRRPPYGRCSIRFGRL